MVVCPQCNTTCDGRCSFCTQCGAELGVRCSRCQHMVAKENLFCGSCGNPLHEEALSQSEKVTISTNAKRLNITKERLPKALEQKMSKLSRTLQGERRQVTVVFADISGFTALSEQLDPEEISEVVNGCFGALSDVIYRYEGYIDKFIGDCVMALFGAPVAHENDAEHAVLCSLDMMRCIEDYNANINIRLEKPLNLHIGVNTGRVVAAKIGSDSKMDYTVIGDTVNIAARLEELANDGEILLSEYTYNQIAEYFSFKEHGLLEVRGRRRPVKVFQILDKKCHSSKLKWKSTLSAPMIGRDREFERLKECFFKLKNGEGQVITAVSEAGIGKSRMWHELNNYMRESGIAKYEGECVIYGQSISYWIFIDLLRNILDVAEGDLGESVSAKIYETVPALVGEKPGAISESTERIVACVSNLLGVQLDGTAERRLQYLPPEQAREETFQSLRDFFCRMAKRIPLSLIFENLHWADSTSLEFITYLMKSATECPLMLFCIYRPVEQHGCWKLGYAARRICPSIFTEVVFKQLSFKESDELVKSLLGAEDIPAEILERIRKKAEGNPFYIEEILRSLIEKKLILQEDKGWKISEGIDNVSIPDTVEGLLMARIDQLTEAAKLVLQCASVVGRSFSREVISYLTENKVNIDACLEELLEAGLISKGRQYPEVEYLFKNILTQEVIYENLLLKRKKELHQRAAEYLEKLCTERIEKYSELLAYHYCRASVFDKASSFLIKAGQKAKSFYANDDAIKYFTEALRILEVEGFPALEELVAANDGLADVYELIGKYEKAIEHLDRIIKLKMNKLTIAKAARKIGRIYEKLGDLDQALTYYSNAFDTLKGVGETVELARVCMNAGWIYNRLANYDKAIELCLRALNILQPTEYITEIAQVHNNLAVIYEYCGEWKRAHMHSQKSIEIATSIGDDRRLGDYYAGAGLLAWKEGNLNKAFEYQQKSLGLMEKTGNTYGKGGVLLNIGAIYIEFNELEEAIENLKEALAIHKNLKAEGKLCKNHRFLAKAYLLAGNYQHAKQHCDEALKIAERVPYDIDAGVLHHILAELTIITKGDPEPHFQEGIRRMSNCKRNYEFSQILMSYGKWQIDTGKKREGEELLKQATVLMEG